MDGSVKWRRESLHHDVGVNTTRSGNPGELASRVTKAEARRRRTCRSKRLGHFDRAASVPSPPISWMRRERRARRGPRLPARVHKRTGVLGEGSPRRRGVLGVGSPRGWGASVHRWFRAFPARFSQSWPRSPPREKRDEKGATRDEIRETRSARREWNSEMSELNAAS